MNELQEQIFDILLKVDKFCTDNDIEYLMYFGTLLGAVRHKGFVPWDDDVDLIMTRENYELFEKIFKESELEKEGFVLQSRNVYPLNAEESIRIRNTNIPVKEKQSKTQQGNLGPWVDVFAYDNVPDDESLRIKQMDTILKCNKWIKRFLLVHVNDADTGIRKYIKSTIQFLNEKLYRVNFILPYLFKKRLSAMTQYNNLKTEFSADLGFLHHKNFDTIRRSYFENDEFGKVVKLEFEGETFSAPEKYKEKLKRNYGDYMKMPKVKERKTHMIEDLKKKVEL